MRDADVLLAAHPEVISGLPSGLRGKTLLLGFGNDETRFVPTPLPVTPTFLFVGRLIEEKGVRTLLEAFAVAARVLEGTRLIVVGDGPLMGWLQEYCRDEGIADLVEIVGVVPHEEIPELLSRCSALCLPSVGEPYGMAVLEAMSAGRAVIAVDRAGPAHLLRRGDGGRLIAANDADALVDAMTELARDPAKLRAMGEANRQHVLAELTCAHMVDQVEAVYERRLTPQVQDVVA
jgi:glycosyltransferase involved in cell wall biosynthesis